MQASATAGFDETVEIAINLGTNPKRGDQAVRGTALLPFGTGKAIRIAAFAEGEDAVAATAAGKSCHADICMHHMCLYIIISMHCKPLPDPPILMLSSHGMNHFDT